jgi:hypothetical protein
VSARESILAPLQCFSIHHWRLYRAPIDTACSVACSLIYSTRVLIASSDANKPRSKHGKSPPLSPSPQCLVARARQDAGERIGSLRRAAQSIRLQCATKSGNASATTPGVCTTTRDEMLGRVRACVCVCDSILPPLAPLSVVSIIAIEKLMSGHAPLLVINFAK